jgi:NADH dehydrogenase [ubiquinone] 1 alpha subcomplex assembly factor 7
VTALDEELRGIIAAEGPITVERYMALCLGHPVHGYYMGRDPFGAAGDFTTAPEISQMVGELIGLWTLEAWAGMREPRPVRLVELGPGRGTLMADLLRAARLRPAFVDAVEVDLVETSPVLRERQREKLAGAPVRIGWRERFSEVPDGPAIEIANEFFDALPARQFVRTDRGWCERLVGLSLDGELAFGLAPAPTQGLPPGGRAGDVLEWPGAALETVNAIAARLAALGGAALVIDYGYNGPGTGETFQAMKRHVHADPLATPGAADLTVHVDFAKLAAAAKTLGARIHGPVGQGAFLRALGIRERAARLQRRATPPQAAAIEQALVRLTDPGPRGMGDLFKVLCISHPHLRELPGFARAPNVAESLA